MSEIIGRINVNDFEIMQVDADPAAAAGTPAPVGSMAVHDSGVIGRLYFKQGLADVAWTLVDMQEGDDWNLDGNALSGAGPTTPNEFYGSTNDYDLIFKRNNQEKARIVDAGLLIGLSASIGGRLQVGTDLASILASYTTRSGGVGGADVIRIVRQFKVQTVDATETVLASIAIVDNQRAQIKFYAGCNQHGGIAGAVGDGADYIRTVSAKALAGAATIQKYSTDFTSEDVKDFKLVSVVNVANIDFKVTGEVDRDLAWSGHAEISLFID